MVFHGAWDLDDLDSLKSTVPAEHPSISSQIPGHLYLEWMLKLLTPHVYRHCLPDMRPTVQEGQRLEERQGRESSMEEVLIEAGLADGWRMENILEVSSEYATGRYPEIHPRHRDHFFLSCASCIPGISRIQAGIVIHSWCHLNPR